MTQSISSIVSLGEGLGYRVTFSDSSTQDYANVFAVNFDGGNGLEYINTIGTTVSNITVENTVSSEKTTILNKLNARGGENTLFIDAASSEDTGWTGSVIHVGDTDAFGEIAVNVASISETTGTTAASTLDDKAFVIAKGTYTNDAIAELILHEADRLQGKYNPTGELSNLNFYSRKINSRYSNANKTTYTRDDVFGTGLFANGENGGVYSLTGEGSNLTVTNSVFTNNYLKGANATNKFGGGALYSRTTCNLTNCVFTANTAGIGGAVKVGEHQSESGNINIEGCTFTQNQCTTNLAEGGGAVRLLAIGTFVVKSSYFDSNTAQHSGGALVIIGGSNKGEDTTRAKIQNITCTNNTVFNGHGGAIRMAYAGQVEGGTFTNNHAGIDSTNTNAVGNDGGAIAAESVISITNYEGSGAVFKDNTALGNGGAIAAITTTSRADNPSATIAGATFTGNTAEGNGGAVYCDFTASTVSLIITECTFDNNNAANGGAIYNCKSKTSITDSRFLTATDTIEANGKTLNLYGTNTFNGNVTATTIEAGTSTMRFENSFAVDLTGSVTDGNLFQFGGSEVVNFKTEREIDAAKIAIVASTASLIGSSRAVATGITNDLTGSTVTYGNGTQEVNGGSAVTYDSSSKTLSAATRFKMVAESTVENADFVSESYGETFGTATLGSDKTVTGKGTGVTTLNGRIFADSKSLEMSYLGYTGTIYGANSVSTGTVAMDAVDMNFSTMSFASADSTRIYGGANASGDAKVTVASVAVTMDNVTLGTDMSVYGGGYLKGTDSSITITNGVTLDIDSDRATAGTGNVFAGVFESTAVVEGTRAVTIGSVNTTIQGGAFNMVGNGSNVTKAASTQGSSTLTINGGSFANYVYGGAFLNGAEATAAVNGNITVNISGGTFNNYVFGGCAAASSKYGANAHVGTVGSDVKDGNIAFNIDATGTNSIAFNKTVYAGNEGAGSIKGNVTVTFIGTADNITWNGKSVGLSGGCQYTTAVIGGDRILQFGNDDNSFAGNYTGILSNRFNKMVVTNDSDVNFQAKTILNSISDWTISADSSLTWDSTSATGGCDFANDTLNITWTTATAPTETATLFDLGSCSLTGWGDNMKVKFNGTEVSGSEGVYTYGNFTLKKVNNTIQLAVGAN